MIDDIFLLLTDDSGIFGQNKMTMMLMILVVQVMMLDVIKKIIMMAVSDSADEDNVSETHSGKAR